MKISKKKEILDVLKDAFRILGDENAWCQRTWALDQYDGQVDPLSSRATKWCISGLLKNLGHYKYRMDVSLDARIYLSSIVQEEEQHMGIMCVNDKEGYKSLMWVLQTAIKRLEEGVNA